RNFGRKPRGIWLPECAYRPRYTWVNPINNLSFERKGIEEVLKHVGIEYFIVDSALLTGGKAIGVYIERYEALKRLWQQFEKSYKPLEKEPRSVYRAYLCGDVSFFARDPKTALQVWSGEWGYPGNGVYLDFHKKHWPGGLRYWRVTNPKADLGEKLLYEPQWVDGVLFEQAEHFTKLCKSILEDYHSSSGLAGIIVAPYDSELFGHWWFEGPRWLKKVLTNLYYETEFSTITLSEYLQKYPPYEIVALPEGSWGEGGFHYIWFNDWTRWSWKLIYDAEEKFVEWVNRLYDTHDLNLKRILAQAARELLLLESSDWQFLISTWSARDYAEQRISIHYESFNELISVAETYLKERTISDHMWERVIFYEKRDPIFPDLDPLLWSNRALNS
ncbi:MAG: 1,4-alpha-glucan branching protein domain-containing protein, partial [bacterium]